MIVNCLIVDDEPLAIELLEQYIAQLPYLSLSGKCFNAMEALHFLQANEVDLVFLDINMPKLTGLELASSLTGQKIIFTTAYSQHAVESYEKDAVDYLLKPIPFERFVQAANKACRLLKEKNPEQLTNETGNYYYIKSGKAMIRISLSEIFFIEGLKDYVIFHTTSGKHIAYKRMKELEESLPVFFSRVHNSFIVNRNHVQRIENNVLLIGEHAIPIGEKYREEFLAMVNRSVL